MTNETEKMTREELDAFEMQVAMTFHDGFTFKREDAIRFIALARQGLQVEELQRKYDAIRDIDLCRRQFPDGKVPGDTEECARGWEKWCARMWNQRDTLQQQVTTLTAELSALKRDKERLDWLLTTDGDMKIKQTEWAGEDGAYKGQIIIKDRAAIDKAIADSATTPPTDDTNQLLPKST